MSSSAPDEPQISSQTAAPCEGCQQPREKENSQFAASDVGALERNTGAGCPVCPLILEGLEKCLGKEAVSTNERLLLVFNGTGVWDFHVIVQNDNDKTVSFFVSPGEMRL